MGFFKSLGNENKSKNTKKKNDGIKEGMLNMKRIATTYTDVKTLSLSLMDEAFSSDDYTVTTENIPETAITDTARRGRRFFFF